MIDSHTHLYDRVYDNDREAVLSRAHDAGVRATISIGCDLETSRFAADLADRHPTIYATIGVHPHEAKEASAATWPEIEKLAARRKVVGFGEIGLDYHYLHSPADVQRDQFRIQIEMAKNLGLPIVVHSREAKEDTLAILREQEADKVGGVLHCFTGDLETARAAIDMNFYISFSGVLTFPNAETLREVARRIPLNRIMIETDCPYLTPVPHRGRRNEPSFLTHTARTLAELHPNEDLAIVKRITAENAARLFRIPISE